MEQEQRHLLALLIHLLHLAREAQNPTQLGFMMVNESRQLLSYRQAAFWLEGVARQVASVSGLADPDPTAPYMQWLSRLFRQLGKQHDNTSSSQCVDASMLPEMLATEWQQWLPEYALWLSLGEHGALLLARESAWSDDEIQLAQELAHGYRYALEQHTRAHYGLKRIGCWFQAQPRRKYWLLSPLLLAFLPIRLSVLAHAEVVPSEPLLIRAPSAGVIDKIQVLPNQSVTQGSALFDLDTTVQAGQYALARQEALAAKERFRISAQMAVTSDKNKLQLSDDKARLESKDISADYSQRELDRMHVVAPGAGVVVFSDRNDWQGKAVNIGEKVMTLADPNKVELTAWLPAADAIELPADSQITLYPNASPFSAYHATLLRIAYKAEVSEGSLLAYRVQAKFVAGETLPVLGQMGTARLYGKWVPLGYYLLRRPITALRQWMGW